MDLDKLLARLQACPEAREWAKGKTLREAWASCQRADWMLWLVGRMEGKKGWPGRPQLVVAACACARRALRCVPDGEERPRLAIEAAEAWAREPTEERRAAADSAAYSAASAADSADRAAASAAYSAYSAADSAASAAYSADRADSAASAAYSADRADRAAASAAYSAYSADRAAASAELSAMADLIRSMLVVPVK